MVEELIREVDCCLKNGCYMAALTTALTLPDICGKAKYPDMTKQTKQRYIQWYNEYIGKNEKPVDGREDTPYLSDELVYSLRCSVLHQGNPNIGESSLDIEYFELIWQEVEGANIPVFASESEIVGNDEQEKAVHIKYSVNIRHVCAVLCNGAGKYYREHKEEFNFFNYNIKNMDFRTRRMFAIQQ